MSREKRSDGTYHFHGGCNGCKSVDLERCLCCCYMSVSVDWDLPSLHTESGIEESGSKRVVKRVAKLEREVDRLLHIVMGNR